MTPEERAQRALIDSPYRTPKVRIAREIQEALDEERAGFRETLERVAVQIEQIEAMAGDAAELRPAISALAREIEEARGRLRGPR